MLHLRQFGTDEAHQIVRSDAQLQTADTRTYINIVERPARRVDECRETPFHTYRRTSAADISRCRQQLLHRYQVGTLVARRLRRSLQIDLPVALAPRTRSVRCGRRAERASYRPALSARRAIQPRASPRGRSRPPRRESVRRRFPRGRAVGRRWSFQSF